MPTASRAHHVQMLVRLPPSMKRWLEDQASEAGTSVNDEVIRFARRCGKKPGSDKSIGR